MKRVLFVTTYLDCGGISKSLQNFLNTYDTTAFSVDVFSLAHSGMFCGNLPNCIILPKDKLIHSLIIHFKESKGLDRLLSLNVKIIDRISNGRLKRHLFQIRARKLATNKYDAVVAFSEGLPTVFVSGIKHRNKCAWIHCDYSSYRSFNDQDERSEYQGFNHIVCVSNFTKQSFLNYYPDLEPHTITINNILNVRILRQMSNEMTSDSFSKNTFNIVSVGRFDVVKRLSAIPGIAKQIKNAGLKFRWYVVGPMGVSGEYSRFLVNLKCNDVLDCVYAVGEKINPYPYIHNADLLVNTSISEACPYVINEAKVLATPVLCTNFGSASEFVENGVNGVICPIEFFADKIIEMITNNRYFYNLKQGASSFEYNNDSILKSMYSIFSE